MLNLAGGDASELETNIKLEFSPIIDLVVRNHLGFEGDGSTIGKGRQFEGEDRLSLEVHIEEQVIIFNTGVIGLQASPPTGNVAYATGDLARERFFSNGIKYKKLYLDTGLVPRAVTPFDMEYSSKELNGSLPHAM